MWVRRCSIVTGSSISGRLSPSILAHGIGQVNRPCSTSRSTARAVKVLLRLVRATRRLRCRAPPVPGGRSHLSISHKRPKNGCQFLPQPVNLRWPRYRSVHQKRPICANRTRPGVPHAIVRRPRNDRNYLPSVKRRRGARSARMGLRQTQPNVRRASSSGRTWGPGSDASSSSREHRPDEAKGPAAHPWFPSSDSNRVPDSSTGPISRRSPASAVLRSRPRKAAGDRQLRPGSPKSPGRDFRASVSPSQPAEDTRFELVRA